MSGEPFVAYQVKGGELWAQESQLDALRELGLHLPLRWRDYLRAGLAGGRGKIAFVETRERRLHLKQLRRGGALRKMWRDRFPGRERLLANLETPARAIAAGVATPPAVALLLLPGPPGFYRGFLAVEALEAEDLASRWVRGAATEEDWRAAMGVIRSLHEAGIEHPDLNLGNIMIDDDGKAWVIDLDKARCHEKALDADRCEAARRRFERSYRKVARQQGVEATDRDWQQLYEAR